MTKKQVSGGKVSHLESGLVKSQRYVDHNCRYSPAMGDGRKEVDRDTVGTSEPVSRGREMIGRAIACINLAT
jgi:hypothetical protein